MANEKSAAGKIAGTLGVAALAAAAAATYYFTGPEGKKHMKQANSWSKQAKEEMVKKIKEMKNVSKQAYEQAAKEVMAKYKVAKNIKPEELATFGMELKSHWDKISKEAAKLSHKIKPVKAKTVKTKAKGKK